MGYENDADEHSLWGEIKYAIVEKLKWTTDLSGAI